MTSEHIRAGRYEALDGLRGLAAFAVFALHLGTARHRDMGATHGVLAVDFFFLLSGFVIGSAYERRLERGLSVPAYLKIRLARLYPMILFGTVLGLATAPLRHLDFNVWLAAIAELLFIPFVGSVRNAYPLNGPQWSLLFELIANVAHAVFYRWLSNRVVALIVAASACLLAVAVLHFGEAAIGNRLMNFIGGFPRVAFSFFAGLLIYRLKDRITLRVPFVVPCLVLLAAVVFPLKGAMVDLAILLIVWPAVMLMAIGSPVPRRIEPIATWAGSISYPLYLVHFPLLYAAAEVISWSGSGTVRAVGWIIAPTAIIGFAWLVEHYYERWARTLGRPPRRLSAGRA